MGDVPQLLTARLIGERLGVPAPRVLYVLRARPGIRPAARAGAVRVFRDAAVEAVAAELREIEARRQMREGGRP